MKNHNQLLGKHNNYLVDGIKTGFVTASGYNLAASATNGQTRLIAVVLGGRTRQQRDRQVDALLKRGFSKVISRKIIANASKKRYKSSYKDMINASAGEARVSRIYGKLQCERLVK